MAKAKPRNKGRSKIKCEYPDCLVTFGRNAERRRHVKEKHGPLICCYVYGCEWTTRRMGRLRAHLKKAHHSEVSTNDTPLSRSRAATPESPVSSCNHYTNSDPNIVPTSPPFYIDNSFWPQVEKCHSASESNAAFNGNEAPHPEYNPMAGYSAALRRRIQSIQFSVFRPCRVRRRTSGTTTRTSSSTSPSLAERASATDSTPHLYPTQQDISTASIQWMSELFNAEFMANFRHSFSLEQSIN